MINMQKYNISKKLRFLPPLLIIAAIFFAVFFFAYKIFPKKGVKDAVKIVQNTKNQSAAKTGRNQAAQTSANGSASNAAEIQKMAEYQNQKYSYSFTYPTTWFLNTEFSGDELKDEGDNVSSGGQTLLSNYQNIGDYDPSNKPKDFHLLGVSVYETQGIGGDELAAKFGFDSEAIGNKRNFRAKNISGSEYVGDGIDTQNPNVAIIFQKDSRFYVFNLDFIAGDVNVATLMENVAATFNVN